MFDEKISMIPGRIQMHVPRPGVEQRWRTWFGSRKGPSCVP
jgi:hypothetical protein